MIIYRWYLTICPEFRRGRSNKCPVVMWLTHERMLRVGKFYVCSKLKFVFDTKNLFSINISLYSILPGIKCPKSVYAYPYMFIIPTLSVFHFFSLDKDAVLWHAPIIKITNFNIVIDNHEHSSLKQKVQNMYLTHKCCIIIFQ